MRIVTGINRGHWGTLLLGILWLALSACGRTTADGVDGSGPPPEDVSSIDVSKDATVHLDASLDSPLADPDGQTPSDVTSLDARGADAHETDEPSVDVQSVDVSVDPPTRDARDLDVTTERFLECTPETGTLPCCTQDQPVWDSSSSSFSYGYGPTSGGCNNSRFPMPTERYDFFAAGGTLVVHKCFGVGGSLSRIVHLTQAQANAIVAAIGSIRTTCVLECVAAFALELSVPAVGVPETYISNNRAACSTLRPVPPFVAYDGLLSLGRLLEEILTAACGLDAGADADVLDPPEAGSCDYGPDASASP